MTRILSIIRSVGGGNRRAKQGRYSGPTFGFKAPDGSPYAGPTFPF